MASKAYNPLRYIPETIKAEVRARDGGVCVWCGSDERIQIDHIIPVHAGGKPIASNLQLLCGFHNESVKGGNMPTLMRTDWFRSNRFAQGSIARQQVTPREGESTEATEQSGAA